MKKTNILLDEKKVEIAKHLYSINTIKELVDFALTELIKAKDREKILSLQGKFKIDINLNKTRGTR